MNKVVVSIFLLVLSVTPAWTEEPGYPLLNPSIPWSVKIPERVDVASRSEDFAGEGVYEALGYPSILIIENDYDWGLAIGARAVLSIPFAAWIPGNVRPHDKFYEATLKALYHICGQQKLWVGKTEKGDSDRCQRNLKLLLDKIYAGNWGSDLASATKPIRQFPPYFIPPPPKQNQLVPALSGNPKGIKGADAGTCVRQSMIGASDIWEYTNSCDKTVIATIRRTCIASDAATAGAYREIDIFVGAKAIYKFDRKQFGNFCTVLAGNTHQEGVVRQRFQ